MGIGTLETVKEQLLDVVRRSTTPKVGVLVLKNKQTKMSMVNFFPDLVVFTWKLTKYVLYVVRIMDQNILSFSATDICM